MLVISSLFHDRKKKKQSMQGLFWLFYGLNRMVFSVKSINFLALRKLREKRRRQEGEGKEGERKRKKEVRKGHLRVRL